MKIYRKNRNPWNGWVPVFGCIGLECQTTSASEISLAFYFWYSNAAPINPANRGCGLFGLDLNSGCACVAMNHG